MNIYVKNMILKNIKYNNFKIKQINYYNKMKIINKK